MSVISVNAPENGCYLTREIASFDTSAYFIKFVSDIYKFPLREYSVPSLSHNGYPYNFLSETIETNLYTLPEESLYQFYNNCNFDFNKDFYSMDIDDKRQYLLNQGLDPNCWDEDNYYFTSNNMINSLWAVTYYPFQLFYHNYFINIDGVFYDLKNRDNEGYISLPYPVDDKQNILLGSFISRRKTEFYSNIQGYKIMPIFFDFDIEQFFDFQHTITYDYEIDPYLLYKFLNRDTYKVFPPILEQRYSTDKGYYTIEKESMEQTLYSTPFQPRQIGMTYEYEKMPYIFGYFNGFMVFAKYENYYSQYIEEYGTLVPVKSTFVYSSVTYKRIRTTKYFSGDGLNLDDLFGGYGDKKCCLAECFGITN